MNGNSGTLLHSSARFFERFYDRTVSVGTAVLLGLAVLLAQSIFWAGHVPLAMKLGVAAVWVLSFFRPADGLLVVAGLAPFGLMLTTGVFDAYSARITEAIALAFLAGYGLRQVVTRIGRGRPAFAGPDEGFAGPALAGPLEGTRTAVPTSLQTLTVLFGAVIVASCLVQVKVWQVQQAYPWDYAKRVFAFLTTAYHDQAGDFRPWVPFAGFEYIAVTAQWLVGLALFLIAITLCVRDRSLPQRLICTTVAAGVGAAALSILGVAEAALEIHRYVAGEDTRGLAALPQLRRWSVFTPKPNTAAAYFLLVLPLAVSLVLARGRARLLWSAAALTISAAAWLTTSLAAFLIFIAIMLTAWVALLYIQRPVRRSVAVLLVLASVVLVIFLNADWLFERGDLARALRDRSDLFQTAVTILGRPLEPAEMFSARRLCTV